MVRPASPGPIEAVTRGLAGYGYRLASTIGAGLGARDYNHTYPVRTPPALCDTAGAQMAQRPAGMRTTSVKLISSKCDTKPMTRVA